MNRIILNIKNPDFFTFKNVYKYYWNIDTLKKHFNIKHTYNLKKFCLKNMYKKTFNLFNSYDLLEIACENGYLKAVKRFINLYPQRKNYLLGIAVSSSRLEVAKFLIKKGANVNNANLTLLSMACATNNFNMIKLLIESGIKINEQILNYNTPYLNANCYNFLKSFIDKTIK